MEILEHQKKAAADLNARARAYFRGSWKGLGLTPRWATLLTGGTGTGKTFLAYKTADTLSLSDEIGDVSLCRISTPSWMPCGASKRGTKETIGVIAKHVATHDRIILVMDEIDKLIGNVSNSNGDAWQSYIRAEAYDLLDGRWPNGLQEIENNESQVVPIEELTDRLKHNVFMIGIGTFQAWFDSTSSQRSMGFGAENNPAKIELSADIIAERMPRELANRFNSSIICLPELGEHQYIRIASEAEKRLPERLQEPFSQEVAKHLQDAIAAKKGVRFLEEAIVEVLKKEPEITLSKTIQP